MGGFCQRRNVRRAAQIVRRGEIDCGGRTGQTLENSLQLQGGYAAPAQGEAVVLRPEPDNFHVQQGGRQHKGLMGVSGGHDHRALAAGRGVEHGEIQHRPNALRRTLR
ncbi:hypothetical protein DSECCO2_330150 [anaerobic digester metagenome]